MNKFLLFFVLLIILIFGFLYFVFMSIPKEVPGTNTVVVVDSGPKLLGSRTLVCNEGKTIDASFYEETVVAVTGQVPVSPKGSVKLKLDDGRTFDLKQAVSADGARYANEGDAFVFWSKGNGALVVENGAEKTYRGCVRVATAEAGVKLPSVYANKAGSFSLRLPGILSETTSGYKIDELFSRVLTPKMSIDGTRFTIPTSTASGTNLSNDSYFSVEHIADVTACNANLFFSETQGTSSVIQNGVSYSVATSSEAAAGNRYEETVYALAGTNPCIAIHYFIHYTTLDNYPRGTIVEFDKKALIASFDQIRQTIVVNQ